MKKITALMLLIGMIAVSSCASNEVAEDDADAMKAEAEAKAADAEADAKAKEAEMKQKAEEEMDQAEADAEAAVEEKKAEAAEAVESASASDDSDSLVSTCSKDGQTRVISVVFDNPETGTVCEVTYEKSSGVQTLWSANNDRGYCQPKAEEFVTRQEGWGWTCTAME